MPDDRDERTETERLLDRYWDETAAGPAAPPPGLDPALAAALRALHARDDAPAASRAFADRLWEDLMHAPTFGGSTRTFPSPPVPLAPMDPASPRVLGEERGERTRRRWPAGTFAAAAMVVLTLAVGALAYRLASPWSGGDEATFGVQESAGTQSLVGSWLIFPVEGASEDDAPLMMTFGADGTLIVTARDPESPDRIGHGVWEATGDASAKFGYYVGDGGINASFERLASVTGTIEVDATGNDWTGDYAIARMESGSGVAGDRTAIEVARISSEGTSFAQAEAEEVDETQPLPTVASVATAPPSPTATAVPPVPTVTPIAAPSLFPPTPAP